MADNQNFECYSATGTFRAENTGYDSWSVYRLDGGNKTFVDWTNDRDDAVRLARMHADMEIDLSNSAVANGDGGGGC